MVRLIEAFGSPEAVLDASLGALQATRAINAGVAAQIQRGIDTQAQHTMERHLGLLERRQWSVVTFLDQAYPSRLKSIHDPPPLLYVSGELRETDDCAMAIVGSRRATPAGRALTEQLSQDLARAGLTIVSGLARGVDGAAHRGALAAGGRTIAVLGCGLDTTYPPEHHALRREVEASGAVITEFPLGTPPHGYNFPRRNRIISGLSLGVLVTEASRESGSLITAALAGEQGREVFAVPGFVKAANSQGPNRLIKEGAKLVEGVEDIVEELLPQVEGPLRGRLQGYLESPRTLGRGQAPGGLSKAEATVLATLSSEPTQVDDIIYKTGLPAAEVSRLLVGMELRGHIRQLPGHFCVRL